MSGNHVAARGRRVAATPPAPISLSEMTARRLHNQVDRAMRNTYKATTGLHILVDIGTRELLAAGASSAQMRQALTDCVRGHVPSRHDDTAAKPTDESQSERLIEVMLEWADRVRRSGA